MYKLIRRLLAVGVCSTMLLSSNFNSLAAENGKLQEINYSFSNNGYTFEKVSHASDPTETADGVVDYLGNHQIKAYTDGEDEAGKGDSTQSYSYCAAASGDWVYIGTMYGALSAYTQAKTALTQFGIDAEVAEAAVDAMFNGKLNKGREADGYYAGSVFFKFNVVTGETKLLMSREMYEKGQCQGVPIFRSAVAYNDKLYFVGLVSQGKALSQYGPYALDYEIMMQTGIPSIYEVDPETDEVSCVYECVDLDGYRMLNAENVFTSTRAIGTYEDYLIAGGLTWDPTNKSQAVVMATKDPSSGDFKVIADMGDLFNYPAIWRDGASGGGGIYQVIEYNGSLYVAIVSGTFDTMDETTRLMRPFALVRGDYDSSKGAIDEKSAWTWTSVIGDKEKDNAKYTYGIDPERLCSNACTLQIYGDYLYIGEYNDVNGGLKGILQYNEFTTLANNLEQSINLYRMDKNEDIELVVGDATEMYPNGSISGMGSGYATHMTQYTWQTTVYDDVMYVATMDETSLLHGFAQFTNGEIANMSDEEWESQMQYLKVLVELLKKDVNKAVATEVNAIVAEDSAEEEAEAEEVTEESVEDTTESTEEAVGEASEEIALEEVSKEVVEEAAEKVVADTIESDEFVDELTEEQVQEAVDAIVEGEYSEELDAETEDAVDTIEKKIEKVLGLLDSRNTEAFVEAYDGLLKDLEDNMDKLPESVKSLIGIIKKFGTLENAKAFSSCMNSMKDSEAGFDLYALTHGADGSVSITTVTTNGFNDRYNHGGRIFAATDDYMVVGTANPFLGTQLWRMAKSPYATYSHEHRMELAEEVAPGCTTEGYVKHVCKNCGETTVETLEATGHVYVEVENIAPTCTAEGRVVTECSACGDRIVEPIKATGHKPGKEKVAKKVAPTYSKAGYITYETACTDCHATLSTRTETLAKLEVPAPVVKVVTVIKKIVGIIGKIFGR